MEKYLIGYILSFAGYTNDYGDTFRTAPLDIEAGKHNTYVSVPRKKKDMTIFNKALSTIYSLVIYSFILWSVPYGIYMSARDSSIEPFGRTTFQILIALQYYFAVAYFKKNQFYENIACNSKLNRYITRLTLFVTVLSLILSIMNVILLNTGINIFIYTDVYNNSNAVGVVLISIVFFVDSLYSYLTFMINACIFVVNMLYHKNVVSAYSKSLKKYIKNSMNLAKKLNIVAIEYSLMRSRFDRTVKLLKNFFSVLNFVGFITTYFYVVALGEGSLTSTEYINLAIFIIIEFVYILAIQSVNSDIQDIGDVISSSTVIATFFGNKQFNRSIPNIEQISHRMFEIHRAHEAHENKLRETTGDRDIILPFIKSGYAKDHDLNIDRVDKNNTSQSFVENLVNRQLRQSHEEIEIDDQETRIADPERESIDPEEPILWKNQEHRIHSNIDEVDNYDSHDISVNPYLEILDRITQMETDKHDDPIPYLTINLEIGKHTMISTISTEHMIDWMLLNEIVSAKWQTFRIFGIEFTDASILSKLFGIAMTILVSAQIGIALNWW